MQISHIFKFDKELGLKAQDLIGYFKSQTDMDSIKDVLSLVCTTDKCHKPHIYLKQTYSIGLHQRKRKK